MKHQTTASFAHTLINRLSAIVGQCQLLREDLTEHSESIDRVLLIENLANAMVEEIKVKQRNILMKQAG